MADGADQKDKKTRGTKGTKIVEREELEKKENQKFNFYIIREMWKRFNTEPLNGLYKQLGISETTYNKVIYSDGYIDFNKGSKKENSSIKSNGLMEYLSGKKIIKIGITPDEWKDHMDKVSKEIADKNKGEIDKDKVTQIKYKKLSDILDNIYKGVIYLPETMKLKDGFGQLCYFCRYGKECNEQDFELRVLEEALNKVELASLYKCKDKRLLGSILSKSKEKLRDIETVYRCLELLERIDMENE